MIWWTCNSSLPHPAHATSIDSLREASFGFQEVQIRYEGDRRSSCLNRSRLLLFKFRLFFFNSRYVGRKLQKSSEVWPCTSPCAIWFRHSRPRDTSCVQVAKRQGTLSTAFLSPIMRRHQEWCKLHWHDWMPYSPSTRLRRQCLPACPIARWGSASLSLPHHHAGTSTPKPSLTERSLAQCCCKGCIEARARQPGCG